VELPGRPALMARLQLGVEQCGARPGSQLSLRRYPGARVAGGHRIATRNALRPGGVVRILVDRVGGSGMSGVAGIAGCGFGGR